MTNQKRQTIQDIKTLKSLGFTYALERKGFLRQQQYYTNHQYLISSSLNAKIKTATNACMKLFQESYEYVSKNISSFEQNLIDLGYNTELIKAFINATPDEIVSNLSRIDFIIDDNDSIKFCEINSATPQGIFENVICSEYFQKRYNTQTANTTIMPKFKSMWANIVKNKSEIPTLYVSAEASYNEDVQTVMLHQHNYPGEIKFIDLKDIQVHDDGVYDLDHNKIELMFMLYPIEFLPYDIDSDGFNTGALFLEHIANGSIQMVNPLSATLIQSKNFVTIIDKLVAEKKLSQKSCDTYHMYFPKSANWDGTKQQIEKWLEHDEKVVLKPVFGRTGKAVQIVTKENIKNALGIIDSTSDETLSWYTNQPHILQEYVQDRSEEVILLDGKKHNVNLIFGAYAIDLDYAGLYLRGDDGCTTDQCILLHPVITD